MSPHKSLFDLTDETLLAGTWQIDGQAVAGIEVLDRGIDAIEHLAVLADNGKTYTIKGHANLMEDEGEHAWAGWVMELDQRRQVYLQIVADAPMPSPVEPSTPGTEETSVTASSPGSSNPLDSGGGAMVGEAGTDETHETTAAEALEYSTPTLDDMLLVTFASDIDESASRPGAASTEQPAKPEKVRKERRRMSQKHFEVFLTTWPLVFFVVFIFFVVSLCVATETEPMGRWPWLTWVTFGMIGVGYLGMWYGPKEAITEGSTITTPQGT